MVICKYCQTKLPENTRFCGCCGRLLHEASIDEETYAPTATEALTPPPFVNGSVGSVPIDAVALIPSQQTIVETPTKPLSMNENPSILPEKQANFDLPTALLPSDVQQAQLQRETQSTPVDQQAGAISEETKNVPNVPTDLVFGAIHLPHSPSMIEAPGIQQGDAAPGQHGAHHQPQIEHGAHHQSQIGHGSHHQPHVEHGAHHQAQSIHGAHHQPQVGHGFGHQAKLAHGVAHHGKQGCRPSCLTVAISTAVASTVVIASLLILFFYILPGGAQPTLSIPTSVNAGEIMTVQGTHFSPNLHILIMLDTQQNAQTNKAVSLSQADLLDSVQGLIYQQPQQGTPLIVKNDGTFTTTIQVEPSWHSGSQHTIYILRQDKSLIVKRQFTVKVASPALALCSVSTSSASITLGPVAAGQKVSVATPFKLCTQGSGLVAWSSVWDTKQAPWLLLARSGSVQAPQTQPLQFNASAALLKAGNYTATVTFKSLHSPLTITLKVTLIVQDQNAQVCIKPGSTSLSLTGVPGQGTPARQAVTISNCGESSNWSAVITTDDGATWLSATPDHGTLQKNSSQDITLTASTTNLVAGTYTGHVTFGSGSNGIDITLIVTNTPQAKPCITVNAGQLSFTANVRGNDPGTQGVTITNSCGTGSWSATMDQSWLGLSATSGNITANGSTRINVQTSIANLAAGIYTGHVSFLPGTATITVTLTVQAIPCISVLRSPLTITATEGNTSANLPETVYISNGASCASGTWMAQSDVPWITLNTSSGSLNAGASTAVSVNVNENVVGTGSFSGHITFSPGSGSSAMTIDLTVYRKLCISARPTSLSFSATVRYPPSPASRTFIVINCANAGTLSISSVTTDDGANWLSAQGGGSLPVGGNQTFTVTVSNPNLSAGSYTGHIFITITGSDGATTSIEVNVAYTMYSLIS